MMMTMMIMMNLVHSVPLYYDRMNEWYNRKNNTRKNAWEMETRNNDSDNDTVIRWDEAR